MRVFFVPGSPPLGDYRNPGAPTEGCLHALDWFVSGLWYRLFIINLEPQTDNIVKVFILPPYKKNSRFPTRAIGRIYH